jgi:ATP-dependent Clp protease ATP-binding subunit ClpC
MEVAKLAGRMSEKGVAVTITELAKAFLLEKGYSKEYGARPLRRAVEQLVEDPLGDKVLSGEVETSPGTMVTVDHEPGKDVLSFAVTRDVSSKQKKKRPSSKPDALRA